MTEPYSFIAMLEITTNDPRLSAGTLQTLDAGSPQTFALIRRAVLQHLPKGVTRVVAVIPTEHAKMLMMLHEAVGEDLGDKPFIRPPPGYVKPTRE